ncbi:MAG: class I SAM-dependent methyltransferase [Calditrichaeota bacterium]|nr:MAG: class I SAM-dependent methyltransferase [Calditrichota bacterium]
MHLSIRLMKILFRYQKFSPVQNLLAQQFFKPSGFWGRIAVDFMAVANRPVYDWTMEFLEIQPQDNVLEIGFGHGIYIEKAAKKADQGFVAGIDFSEAMVKRARRFNKHLIRRKKVALLHNDMQPIPYPDTFFDCAFAVNVIYFWNKPENELREIYRVLKPGGILALYFTNKDSLQHLPFTTSNLFRKYAGDAFAAIVKKAGFTKVSCHTRLLHFKEADVKGHCVVAMK